MKKDLLKELTKLQKESLEHLEEKATLQYEVKTLIEAIKILIKYQR